MTRFEYLAIWYGVILGLSLGNIASSVHKLLEAGRRVRWHWMAPLNTAGVTVATLGQFWDWWVLRSAPDNPTIFLILLPGHVGSLLLYVVCASTLPDEVPDTGVDLREFYFSSHRRFWALLLIFFLLRLFQVAATFAFAGFEVQSVRNSLPLLAGVLVLAPLAASLIFVRAPWWHGLCLCLFFAAALIMFGPMKV